MSEELLKALMQLYAIVAKQNEGPSERENEFISSFLSIQVGDDRVEKYFNLFKEFTNKKNNEKRVSVSDSVSIIGIARDINKILTQKQKIVVLIKLFELIHADVSGIAVKLSITQTIADVFNISPADFKLTEAFVLKHDFNNIEKKELLIIDKDKQIIKIPGNDADSCSNAVGIESYISVIRIQSINLYLYKVNGGGDVKWNGSKIQNNVIYVFANGGIIQFNNGKSIYYQEIVSYFSPESSFDPLSFNVNKIQYIFPNGNVGLYEINLSEGPGKLIGIMGASGSGKTTLLNIISGIEKPTKGEVLLNGINIHTDSEKIKGSLGFVPQDDLLIEELTVYENLFFNAKFCFSNLSNKEIEMKVLNLLELLGLIEVRNLKVGNVLNKVISGGQRKRLNIALELIREPSILFLDEPTSGLSSRDSENILKLLSQLTAKGNLVFLVIHQPNSDIYKLFDKIILLDKGGYIIYNGNPIEAINYFKKIDHWINNEQGECPSCGNINSESIFNIIEAETINEFGNYTGIRKVLPQKWNEYFINNTAISQKENIHTSPQNSLHTPSNIHQFFIYFKRDLCSKISNKQYLLVNLIEIPLLAFLLSFIVRYTNDSGGKYIYRENENIPAYIFMSIIVFSFMGISISAEEIFKDRKILKREKFLNLSWSSYLVSKIGILFFISAIQSFLFVLIGNSIVEIQGMFMSYWLVLFSISCCANIIGLNISSAFDSVVTIYILIPLLLIPQMILGGAMFSYEKLNKYIGGGYQVPYIAELIPARWAYEALIVDQFKNNEFEKKFYELEKEESIYNYKRGPFVSHLTKIADQVEQMLKDKKAVTSYYSDKIKLLHDEIEKEIKNTPSIYSFKINDLMPQKINQSIIDTAKKYLERVEGYFTSKLNKIVNRKEQLLYKLQENNHKQTAFRKLKDSYYNEHLADIVKCTFSVKKNIESNNKLIQIVDPIFYNPGNTSPLNFRTHFFAPLKSFTGYYFDTFYFNLLIIWLFIIILSIALYFNILKKIIHLF